MTELLGSIRHGLLFLIGVIVLSACAGTQTLTPEVSETRTQPSAVSNPLGVDEVLSRLGTMPRQQIPPGECGLFLWVKRENTPLVFFQRSNGQAFMHIDSGIASLVRTGAEDQFALQFHQQQIFSFADMTVKVSVTPEQTRSLQQGLKLPTGSISVSTEDGWSAALPVAGIIGCQ